MCWRFASLVVPCSKRLAPTWEDLSNLVKDNVVIGHVDCTEEKDFCAKHEVQN